tara:strand:- start:23 stop:1156 length:1134 start_codon:yes stop_codon:yes gene_type:complete
MERLFLLLFLGISLQSYYFYGSGGPLISIASLFIMGIILFLGRNKPIYFPHHFTSKLSIWYLVVLLWSIIGILIFSLDVDFKRFFGFIIVSISSLISYRYLSILSLEKTVRFFLLINIIFFYIQLFGYYVFQIKIDYLIGITGEAQRMFGGAFNVPFFNTFIRPTGLYQEPGTYATFLAPLIALFGRYSHKNQNKYIFIFSVLSLFLSFSIFGIIFGSLIVLNSDKVRFSLKIVLGFVLSLIAYPYLRYRFIILRGVDTSTGIDFRANQINETIMLFKENIGSWFFGTNLISVEPMGVSLTGAYNDTGLLFYLLLFLGPLITICTMLYLLKISLNNDIHSKVGILIVLMSKISIFAPFFPFILNFLLWEDNSKETQS